MRIRIAPINPNMTWSAHNAYQKDIRVWGCLPRRVGDCVRRPCTRKRHDLPDHHVCQRADAAIHEANDTNRMVLEVWNGSMNSGAPVQLWRQNGNQQQLWDIYELTEHYNCYNVYELHNNKSIKCPDMAIDGAVQDGTRVQQWTCSNGRAAMDVQQSVQSEMGRGARWRVSHR